MFSLGVIFVKLVLDVFTEYLNYSIYLKNFTNPKFFLNCSKLNNKIIV